MQCPHCQFENMPGITTCFRCGSVMEASAPLDIEPPRAPRWKKRLRRVTRGLPGRWNAHLPRGIVLSGESRLFGRDIPPVEVRQISTSLLLLLQSLVPGLPWFLRGECRKFRWGGGLWLASIGMALFWHGSALGELFRGLAVAVHALLIGYANGLGHVRKTRPRVFVSLLLVALLWMPYRLIPRSFPVVGMNMAIPAQRLEVGDAVVAWRGVTQLPVSPSRGAVVLCPAAHLLYGYYGVRYGQAPYPVPAQIVGLPGESVRLQAGQFVVDGHVLPPDSYPMPIWLQGIEDLEITVPDGAYLAATEFNAAVPRDLRLEDRVADVMVIPASSLQERAVMRWYPLRRRGFLHESL